MMVMTVKLRLEFRSMLGRFVGNLGEITVVEMMV
jgi:hypothetical protein